MTALGDNGPIVVIGAGPAGALMALNLAKQGHRVELYESRPDLRSTSIDAGRSINLALATRGIVALQEVGAMERVDAITIPMAGRMIHDLEGNQTLQPYGSNRYDVIHSVSRTDLNAILLDEAQQTGLVDLHFEHWCRRVDLEARVAYFSVADSRPTDEIPTDELRAVPFGVVFGCDGANSEVRQAMEAKGLTVVQVEPLGHAYKELTLPAGDRSEGADEQDRFLMDPNALHIWPRGEFMLIALANPEGDFTVTLFMPNEPTEDHPESFATVTTDAEIEAFFTTRFGDFAALTPDFVAQFHHHPIGSLATIRTTGWSYDDRAVCVGDAAHAIVPFHGQGMNLAMESVMHLADHLAAHPDDLAAAFKAFEADRKADADAIADMALENYVEMRSGVIDPDYLIKRELALTLEQRFPHKFKARYQMVMFTTIPYAQVRRRARRQGEILAELVKGVGSVDEVDFARAERLLADLPDLPEDLVAPRVSSLTLADEGPWDDPA